MNASVRGRIIVLLGVAALLLATVPAYAQRPVAPEFDNHAFRFVLFSKRFTPLRDVGELVLDPSKSLLVVFGNVEALDQPPLQLRQFVEDGGAVLVATDRLTGGALQKEFAVYVTGRQVTAPEGERAYRDDPAFPFVNPLPVGGPNLFPPHQRVATNKPSFLGGHLNKLPWLAVLPTDCSVEGGRSGLNPLLPFPFAVGGDVGQGRILVLSDHSVFINSMMLQPDNGNFDFAYNCINWLTNSGERGREKRDRVLFIDEGRVEPSFEVPLQSIPDLPFSPVDAANQVIAAAEQDDLFNRVILENVSLRQVKSGWVLVLTVTLVAYGLYRLMKAGYHVDAKVPLVSRSMARLAPAVGVVDQRHQALLREGNFWETARDLARLALADLGYEPPRPPQLRLDAGWWERFALRRHVRRLWQVAYGDRPVSVSRQEFARLLDRAAEVRAAANDGRLQLDGGGGKA